MIFATACAANNIMFIGAAGNVPSSKIIKKFIDKKLNTPTKKNNFIRCID